MRINLSKFSLMVAAMLLSLASCASATSHIQRVDKDTLKSWLDNSQVEIIDVRTNQDWEASDKKIKGALRQDPTKVAAWMSTLPKDKKIVLYCA